MYVWKNETRYRLYNQNQKDGWQWKKWMRYVGEFKKKLRYKFISYNKKFEKKKNIPV